LVDGIIYQFADHVLMKKGIWDMTDSEMEHHKIVQRLLAGKGCECDRCKNVL